MHEYVFADSNSLPNKQKKGRHSIASLKQVIHGNSLALNEKLLYLDKIFEVQYKFHKHRKKYELILHTKII